MGLAQLFWYNEEKQNGKERACDFNRTRLQGLRKDKIVLGVSTGVIVLVSLPCVMALYLDLCQSYQKWRRCAVVWNVSS